MWKWNFITVLNFDTQIVKKKTPKYDDYLFILPQSYLFNKTTGQTAKEIIIYCA